MGNAAAQRAAPSSRRSHLTLRPIESAGLVEGEADLRWLGDASSELLVAGRLVLRPGVSIFAIDGEIAR